MLLDPLFVSLELQICRAIHEILRYIFDRYLWSVLLQQLVLLLYFTFHMWCWSFWGGMYLNVIMSHLTAFFSQKASAIFHIHSDVWTKHSISQSVQWTATWCHKPCFHNDIFFMVEVCRLIEQICTVLCLRYYMLLTHYKLNRFFILTFPVFLHCSIVRHLWNVTSPFPIYCISLSLRGLKRMDVGLSFIIP
jgi:hypothetical protein